MNLDRKIILSFDEDLIKRLKLSIIEQSMINDCIFIDKDGWGWDGNSLGLVQDKFKKNSELYYKAVYNVYCKMNVMINGSTSKRRDIQKVDIR